MSNKTTEQELLEMIEESNYALNEARNKIKSLTKEILDTETDLIGLKIDKERLVEQLRKLRLRTVDRSMTDREVDIDRFKKALPGILDKDK